jgi:Tfp pilus assembly protein PilN
MRAVNLLPEDPGGSGPPLLTTTTVGVGGVILFVVLAILLGGLFVQAHNTASDKHHKLEAVQQQTAQVEAEASARQAAAQSGKAAVEGRVTAFDTAVSQRTPWDNLLDDISRVLPAGSWLSSMSMAGAPVGAATTTTTPTTTTAPATSGTASPDSLSVSGVAFSTDIVALVMRRLALIPALSDVTLQSTTRADIGSTKAFSFSLIANVNPPQTTPQTEAQ